MKKGIALITGASSGIGKAFAYRLGRMGYNLILVARREGRLIKMSSEMKKMYNVEVLPLKADLSREVEIKKVEKKIKEMKEIDFLVNNAGFGIPGLFSQVDIEKYINMINVHIIATVRLTHAVLPFMIERNRGIIINVSSMAGFIPRPGSTMYNATKSFLNLFSESLQMELKNTKIKIQSLCPGFTYTEFHDRDDFKNFNRNLLPRFLWMEAEDVVDESLKALKSKKVIFIPGFKNRVFYFFLKRKFLFNIILKLGSGIVEDLWIHPRRN